MGLSRLDNFLKNARGNILYVNPNDIDSTDSIENQGNSLTRPFKTIQRALIEAARFSYQRGLNNDRFGQTTILVYPGEHIVDNRPGFIPDGLGNFRKRDGQQTADFTPFNLSTNFDLTTDNNALYKLNSIHGGVILPRGTSLIGFDLRKTTIRPKYVPDPENDNIERSAVFRVTGSCYLWQFTVFDGDPNGQVYKDYTNNLFAPNFSHHKLTCFEYADGKNNVKINDLFTGKYETNRTDLDIYYEKVGIAYGTSSGRPIEPDYPSASLDIQSKIDEYRIVGSLGAESGISSIRAGNGIISDTTITVQTADPIEGLQTDTPIQISGFSSSGYNGQYVVSEIISDNEFQYEVQNAPNNPLPNVSGAKVNLTVDTVTSSSPYIFNISMRSVYGMCGLHADGDKADGFKSMVVAQFTGIGLQKDDKAFLKYDSTAGRYKDYTYPGNDNLHTDSRSVYKPEYQNYHIKASNNAFLQLVSIFAIGYAAHFVAESGGDHSITNSNSNFGAKSLVASGYRKESFYKDDVGYITHIIPPKDLETVEGSVEFLPIDVNATISAATTSHLYLYNETNIDTPPSSILDGYRLGAKVNDTLNVIIGNTTYSSKIVMHNPSSLGTSEQKSFEKRFSVGKSISGINSITSDIVTLTSPHNFSEGESIRIISDNGSLPDGLENNRVYYAITSGVGINTSQLKIAQSRNDAINQQNITLNNRGGNLSVVSRVSDKLSGELGHPIQFDSSQSQWYVNVSAATTENQIYPVIVGFNTNVLGNATPRTYILRRPDNRSISDTLYKIRYVIPAGSGIDLSRPPIDGYVIQDSSDTGTFDDDEAAKYFSPITGTQSDLDNETELRNCRFISSCSWSSTTKIATFETELPHDLLIGNIINILNVQSTNNIVGLANSGYNGEFSVVNIFNSKEFSVSISEDPGTFLDNTFERTATLPRFIKRNLLGTYQIYRSQEIQRYVQEQQDGIYHLVVTNVSNSPEDPEFNHLKFSQPIQNLYPQTNRDNPNVDPKPAKSYALSYPIGQVVVDDPQHSITKENVDNYIKEFNIGIGITNGFSNITGTAVTFMTSIDHGFNRITQVSIADSGGGYGTGIGTEVYYNAKLIDSPTGRYATARISVFNGNVTDVKIIDGGSSYLVGDTLRIVGIPTISTGYKVGIVSVTNIYNNVGDTIKIENSDSTLNLNGYYTILSVPGDRSVELQKINGEIVSIASTLGYGINAFSNSTLINTGPTLDITSLLYNNTTGIATIATSQNHGLNVDNKVLISNATNNFYNTTSIVKRVIDLKTFTVNLGISTSIPLVSGSLKLSNPGYISYGGNTGVENENIGGRFIPQSNNLRTTLSSAITDAISDIIFVNDLNILDLNIGDYLLIDDEIVRIKRAINNPIISNEIRVFRGVLGTKARPHINDSVVTRIKVQPIEFRRNSIIRASGHTFEYVGFGPGNYSTSLPDRQDREITPQEELLAQATKIDGGLTVFTGMNNDGDFYVGNKKVSSATGQEEVFDAPIPTVTGEDVGEKGVNIGFDVLTPLEATISRSLRVEGGNDNNIISEFDGPVVFTNKITSTSEKGIEANSIYLQGDTVVSRKYTVGISTPTESGTPGDVVYNANPFLGGSIGWVYTTNNSWSRFGNVSASSTSNIALFDGVGIGVSIAQYPLHVVGSGSTTLFVDGSARVTGILTIGTSSITLDGINDQIKVGSGITLNANNNTFSSENNIVKIGTQLNLDGNTGIISATKIYGDGSDLINLPNDSLWLYTPGSTGLYPLNLLTDPEFKVGLGTSDIEYKLHIGGVSAGGTDLYVENQSRFIGTSDFNNNVNIGGNIDVSGTANILQSVSIGGSLSVGSSITVAGDTIVTGKFIATNFTLNNSNSNIVSGIITCTSLYVGTGFTGLVVTPSRSVGIRTATPRSDIDLEGRTRFKNYYEETRQLTISSGVVDIDLSQAQTFILTPTTAVTSFRILNPPPGATAFTLLVTQGSTPYSVGIDTFRTSTNANIPVYWSGGGIVPEVTVNASAKDIYSFMIFDGNNLTTSGLYGVPGGQNFL
jgi:hypothetical protein